MSKLRKPAGYVVSVPNGCWVDLYSGTYFTGRLKRIYGPGRIRIGLTGSLIVGPDAFVVPAGRNHRVNLGSFRSRRLVPDLDVLWREVKLKSLQIIQADGDATDHF